MLLRVGCRVVKDVLSDELVSRCRDLLLSANDDLRQHGRVGREGFYSPAMQNLGVGGAHNTKRLFDIIELDGGPQLLGEVLERTDGRLRPILEAVLGKGFYLGSFQSLTLDPDATLGSGQRSLQLKESLHADYPFYSAEQSLPAGIGSPFTIQCIWMITDFTEQNGGTPLLKGSHRFGRPPVPAPTKRSTRGLAAGDDVRHAQDWATFERGARPTTGSSGDVLVYLGQCWHAVSVNTTDAPRVGKTHTSLAVFWIHLATLGLKVGAGVAGLLGQWLPFYFAPMEAHMMTTPPDIKAALPGSAAELLVRTPV